jgi:hypothetical protein
MQDDAPGTVKASERKVFGSLERGVKAVGIEDPHLCIGMISSED